MRTTNGAVLADSVRLGNLSLEAGLEKATAVSEPQRVFVAARIDDVPLQGARVRFDISNSFGSARQNAPDTDVQGRSSKVWQTYQSVGLNRMSVQVTAPDGRSLVAHLSYFGIKSAPAATPTATNF